MATVKRTTSLSLLALALAGSSLSAQDAAASRAALRIQADRAALGIDARHDFRAMRTHRDELGQVHTRLQQTFQGVKVWGGEIITHQDAEGAFRPHTLAHLQAIELSTVPALGAAEALAIAHLDLAPKGPYAYAPTSELVIYPVSAPRPARLRHDDEGAEDRIIARYALAYHVHTQLENGVGETKHMEYMIDARNGAILAKWNSLRTGAAVGTGKSQWYGTVSLNTNSTASGFELRDMTRGSGGTYGNNVTTNLNHSTSGNGTIYTDTDNAWGDGNAYPAGSGTSTTGPTGQTAAVDAHRGLQATWDFYKNVFNRNGIDNTGKATYSRMHYSSSYDNAFWDDSCFCMTYGDGNPPSGSYGEADLDTAGHEMSHGVCAATANLTYSGESGGLNESNSDIFGTCVEFYTLGANGAGSVVPDNPGSGSVTANYTMFENSWGHPGQALRYMYRPDIDGGSANYWYSGVGSLDVHYSSGPNNRMFYFLAKGATTSGDTSTAVNTTRSGVPDANFLPSGMTGIGNDKAARIWYRALTVYLTSSSTYAAARTAAINSAKDLYGAGGPEEQAVWNAFHGINVGAAWSGGGSTTVTASITTPSSNVTVATGTAVSFAGSATGGTSPYTYGWTFGDGGTATGASASHTFTNTGSSNVTYTVTFTANDSASHSGSATRTVTVTPAGGGLTMNETESNNTTGTANAVVNSGTTVTGYISSSSDTDYFKVSVPAGHTFAATLTPPSTSDFDLYLYNASGTQVASSIKGTGAVDAASVTNSGSSTVTYYARVKYYAGASTTKPYTLKLTF